jgi:hypothetical protein
MKCYKIAATLCALCLSAPTVRADFWNEQGQAGDLPGTAQYIPASFPLEGIRGTLGSVNEVNMYAFWIVDAANFSATTVGTPGTLKDTHLFLFDANGHGVYANDDASSTDKRSTLPANDPNGPQTPGLYFLAISSFGRDAVGGPDNDLIFPDFPFTGVFGPSDPTAVISGWRGAGSDSGSYTILLTGTIPEPSSIVLFMLGCGCAAIAGYRRRKRLQAA